VHAVVRRVLEELAAAAAGSVLHDLYAHVLTAVHTELSDSSGAGGAAGAQRA